MSLQGKVALITGGANGIGKGIARYLLSQEMRVVIADIDPVAGADTVRKLQTLGAVHFIATDISDELAVQAAIAETLTQFGQLDGLVNNAGIANPETGPVEQLSLSEWQRVLNTNLSGYFLCAKHAIPALRQQQGAIVNIASSRALQSEPNTEAYASAKGGILALTHALAVSLGPAIRVNAISPGWIDVSEQPLRTEDHQQHPVGRVGQAADIAALTAFLLDSSKAQFMTGENVVMDGGMRRKMQYLP